MHIRSKRKGGGAKASKLRTILWKTPHVRINPFNFFFSIPWNFQKPLRFITSKVNKKIKLLHRYYSRLFPRFSDHIFWQTVNECFYTILIDLFFCLCVEKKFISFLNIYNLFRIYIFSTLFFDTIVKKLLRLKNLKICIFLGIWIAWVLKSTCASS